MPQARDLRIRLRGTPFEAKGTHPQTVTATLNGSASQSFEVSRGLHEYEIGFLAAATRQGVNRLELRYAWTRRPCDVSSARDRRELAVAWDYVHVLGLTREAETGPQIDSAKGTIFIPWGASLRYYLRLPQEGVFSVERLRRTGNGHLEVRLERDGAPAAEVLSRGADSSGGATARLPFGGVARLTLTAVAPRLGEPGGLTLVAPMVSDWPQPPPPAPRRIRARPPIVVYVIDTLRADHLGCYGYGRPLSPRIDAFARDSIVFEDAVTEASWTRPAIASLFTGLPARVHGVNGRNDALPPEAVTFAELLSGLGYQTAGFAMNGNVAREFGFDQGFSAYELLPGALRPGPLGTAVDEEGSEHNSSAIIRRVVAWLGDRRGKEPVMLYVHTADPHSPYSPAPEWKARFAPGVRDIEMGSVANLRRLAKNRPPVDEAYVRDLVALYDAEIASADEGFGQLLDELRRSGLYDDAVVLLVADHGEEFHDHGYWEHGRTLYSEVVHVPLILKLPSNAHQKGLRIHGMVQLQDALPTLMDLVGEAPPPSVVGKSLLGMLGTRAAPWSGVAYSFLDVDLLQAESVQADGFKMIRRPTDEGLVRTLYDLTGDPSEHQDLLATRPIMAGYLESILDARVRVSNRAWSRRQFATDGEVEESLRSLGYVQ